MTEPVKPLLTVHVTTWNEEQLLPYFLRHYERYAERIVVYDNESTDRTCEIAAAHPKVELRSRPTGNEIDDQKLIDFKNNCWKQDTSMWSCVVDCDEFVWHPELPHLLRTGLATVLHPTAYVIASEEFPVTDGQLCDFFKAGRRDPNYDKCVLFRPGLIQEIAYRYGAHYCQPQGTNIIRRPRNLLLYHFQMLGRQRIVERWVQLARRLSTFNKERKLGSHYVENRDELNRRFTATLDAMKPIVIRHRPGATV